jgi:hypothetical protein
MISELTDDLLMAQAFLFLTTSTTLEFLLFRLSRNPKAHQGGTPQGDPGGRG